MQEGAFLLIMEFFRKVVAIVFVKLRLSAILSYDTDDKGVVAIESALCRSHVGIMSES